jgi:hypothetical protein
MVAAYTRRRTDRAAQGEAAEPGKGLHSYEPTQASCGRANDGDNENHEACALPGQR